MSSQASGAHHVAALAFDGAPEAALARLKRIVIALPRTRLAAEAPNYLRAEAASRLFGFVDDVEFLVDPNAGLIHVRSAARIGYSDFGVNRRRVETIRAAFSAGPVAQ